MDMAQNGLEKPNILVFGGRCTVFMNIIHVSLCIYMYTGIYIYRFC